MTKVLLALALLLGSCDMLPVTSKKAAEANVSASGKIALPAPSVSGTMSLEEALEHRRSVREFRQTPLTERELSQLLWAAQGISSSPDYRTAPSAGALYPLELYVSVPTGFYHYEPQAHRLDRRSDLDLRLAIYRAALEQTAIREAPAVFVIAAVYERTARKYGPARSPRYICMEVGHAAQNLLLEAVALSLGAVPIGAFDDLALQKALGLHGDHKPLYLIPVGKPR